MPRNNESRGKGTNGTSDTPATPTMIRELLDWKCPDCSGRATYSDLRAFGLGLRIEHEHDSTCPAQKTEPDGTGIADKHGIGTRHGVVGHE